MRFRDHRKYTTNINKYVSIPQRCDSEIPAKSIAMAQGGFQYLNDAIQRMSDKQKSIFNNQFQYLNDAIQRRATNIYRQINPRFNTSTMRFRVQTTGNMTVGV